MEKENEKQNPVTLFGNAVSPSQQRKAAALLRKKARKYRFDPNGFYPLFAENNRVIGPLLGVKNVVSGAALEKIDAAKGVLIGTIRMGYGHYRIGMAIASAARSMGLIPYWFDLLAFRTPGARMIADLEYWYSLGSRISQQSRVFNRLVWDPLTGKAYKRVRKNYPIMEVCRLFADIYRDLPRDMPFVGTHPWPALGAVHAGMTNVVNAIPDNCPLGFHLAPGALHTVQSPSAYLGFRTLKDMGDKGEVPNGVPADEIALAGHYVDHELVANAEADCATRVRRMRRKEPRRLLISVGGAGAQQELFIRIVTKLMPLIHDDRVVLFLNFGDHRKVWDLVRKSVRGFDAMAQEHFDWAEAVHFAQAAVEEPVNGLHVFLNEDAFAAVYATNLLMRCSDILVTKPSELAFYPIPTLLLQRVGGHEAWGAIRAAELGYGTPECTSLPLTMQTLDLMILEDDVPALHCEHIVKLKQIGVYNGAYRVVELAQERRGG
jgi:hypothetical protein